MKKVFLTTILAILSLSCIFAFTACSDNKNPMYTVTWINYDGSILEVDNNVEYGATPNYDGNTPTKPGDDQYSYSFSGWTPSVTSVSGDKTYTAQFTQSVRKYTITWKNYDGSVLKTDSVAYGTTPSYNGTPTKPSTVQYTYTFNGWTPSVTSVAGDKTYTAQFTQSVRKYTITWKNYDGSVLKTDSVAYGTTPSYNGTPTKPSTVQYTYTFNGWTPSVTSVTGNTAYTAQFSQTVNKYTITWKNYDGSTLKTDSVEYGKTPSYNGTPTKPSDEQYSYTFSGWSPSVVSVMGDKTYTAQFTQKENKINLTLDNYDNYIIINASISNAKYCTSYGERAIYSWMNQYSSIGLESYIYYDVVISLKYTCWLMVWGDYKSITSEYTIKLNLNGIGISTSKLPTTFGNLDKYGNPLGYFYPDVDYIPDIIMYSTEVTSVTGYVKPSI